MCSNRCSLLLFSMTFCFRLVFFLLILFLLVLLWVVLHNVFFLFCSKFCRFAPFRFCLRVCLLDCSRAWSSSFNRLQSLTALTRHYCNAPSPHLFLYHRMAPSRSSEGSKRSQKTSEGFRRSRTFQATASSYITLRMDSFPEWVLSRNCLSPLGQLRAAFCRSLYLKGTSWDPGKRPWSSKPVFPKKNALIWLSGSIPGVWMISVFWAF